MGAGTSSLQVPRGWRQVPGLEHDSGIASCCICPDEVEEVGRRPEAVLGAARGPHWNARGRRLALAALALACIAIGLVGSLVRSGWSARQGSRPGDALGLSSADMDGEPGTGHIVDAERSDLCFQVADGLTPPEPHVWPGTQVRLWHCQNHPTQMWTFPAERGLIRWKAHPELCLDIAGNRTDNGNWLQLWWCNEDLPSQQWLMPALGEGRIRWEARPDKCIDGSRWRIEGERKGAKLQIWDCAGDGTLKGTDQLFLIPSAQLLPVGGGATEASPSVASECEEDRWAGRLGSEVCSRCSVPVDLQTGHYGSCSKYCGTVGRFCASAHTAKGTDAPCEKQEEIPCSSERDAGVGLVICKCGAQMLRGQYGFLSEFDVSEAEIRRRVLAMSETFGIREFQFYRAFEGFSHPPAFYKDDWNCAVEGRPVQKAVLSAAAEQIRSLGGRSWFSVHADSVDIGDNDITMGHTLFQPWDVIASVDPAFCGAASAKGPEELGSYEELCACESEKTDGEKVLADEHNLALNSRLIDVVVIDATWAVRYVPPWAEFVSSLNISGIHWNTFGRLGHWVAEQHAHRGDSQEPDLPGFLRAALPILRARGLEQTMNFMDGFGWDRHLLGGSTAWLANLGPVVAFPYFEVWNNPLPPHTIEKTLGSTRGYVLACYPGYNQFHCCSEDERQNTGSYGIWPVDLGISRWRRALADGGSYVFVGDGLKYARSASLGRAAALSDEDVRKLQMQVKVFKSVDVPERVQSSGHGYYSTYVYAVKSDHKVYRKPLDLIDAPDSSSASSSRGGDWTLVMRGDVKAIAADHQDAIYATDLEGRLVKLSLQDSTRHIKWHRVSAAEGQTLRSIYVGIGMLYGVTESNETIATSLVGLGEGAKPEEWRTLSTRPVRSFCVQGDSVFATDAEGAVFKQSLATMTSDSPWLPAARGPVQSLVAHGDSIYAVDPKGRIVKQKLSTMLLRSTSSPAIERPNCSFKFTLIPSSSRAVF
mmetsp:Transcript_84302/g.271892  ORF Transcript_84302/g.271892 Transcript_84302/m.271892 type:complete len:988 (-) Transcript_84302:119-3082(-)